MDKSKTSAPAADMLKSIKTKWFAPEGDSNIQF